MGVMKVMGVMGVMGAMGAMGVMAHYSHHSYFSHCFYSLFALLGQSDSCGLRRANPIRALAALMFPCVHCLGVHFGRRFLSVGTGKLS